MLAWTTFSATTLELDGDDLMHGGGFFFQAFIYLAAAVVSVPVAKRLGLGSVLGYLLAGVVIGPRVLGLVGGGGEEDVMHFAEFGVVMMLFVIGLELEPARLWRLRGSVFGLGGLQLSLTALALAGALLAAGFDWRPALALGLILSLSSTAMVLQTLAEKGWMSSAGGQSSFAVLLFQDIAVIPLLALLPLLAVAPGEGSGGDHGHGAEGWIEQLAAWQAMLVIAVAIGAMVLVGRLVVRWSFRLIAQTRLRELVTAGSLLLVIGIALLMDQLGLSPALGTFLAGVVLANSEYRHELEATIEPFKGLLLGLFFIAVGASIDFALVAEDPARMAAQVAALIVIKFLVLALLARLFGLRGDSGLLFSCALAQAGEFGFVLLSFASQNGVLTTEVVAPITAVVALSMAATPIVLLVYEKLLRPHVGTRREEKPEADAMEGHSPVLIAGYGRFGQIVGRLLVANGVKPTVLDDDPDTVELLRRFGHQVFYGDATRVDLLEAAGAGEARLLVVAIDKQEKALRLVHTARRHFPHLEIVARAAGRTEAYELLEAGVDDVFRETFDSALRTGSSVLQKLGFRANRAHRSASLFRRLDELHLEELAQRRGDQKAYISASRENQENLARTLLDDVADSERYVDGGWSTRSLRQDARLSGDASSGS